MHHARMPMVYNAPEAKGNMIESKLSMKKTMEHFEATERYCFQEIFKVIFISNHTFMKITKMNL